MKKTNRTFKRFAAITSASLLAACAVMPAVSSALDFTLTEPTLTGETTSLLPEGAVIQETVSAYQVFTISKVDDLYNVEGWGSGVKSADLITAITSNATDFQIDGENDTKVNAFAGITAADDDSAQKVGAALAKLSEEQQEAFAKAVMNNLNAATATGKYENNKVSFTTIENGYYIMSCEVKKDNGASYTSESLGMLTVVDNNLAAGVIGNIGENGQAKVGLPTVVKKVKENNDVSDYIADNPFYADYNDVADYEIGDKVPFLLEATLPSNFAEYDAYYLKFTDTLANGFVAPAPEDIEIYVDKVKVDSNVFNIHKDVTGQNITITIEDVNALADNVLYTSKITVKYNAVLDTDATVGLESNDNEVFLEYSNNPNVEYNPTTNGPKDSTEVDKDDDDNTAVDENETTPETPNDNLTDNPDTPGIDESKDNTGETPTDKVTVHTYTLKFNKEFYNAASDIPLTPEEITAGVYNTAEFGLKKGSDYLYFAPCLEQNYDYVLVEIEGETDEEKAADIAAKQATTVLNLKQVGEDLVIRIKGLDAGTYVLEETKTPKGFNTAPKQTITIDAGTTNIQEWDGNAETLDSFSWTITPENGTATSVYQGKDKDGNKIEVNNETLGHVKDIDAMALATMENRKGSSLPSTGGIGTTIFYLGGGAMAAIGGVYLISKRRMKKSEE